MISPPIHLASQILMAGNLGLFHTAYARLAQVVTGLCMAALESMGGPECKIQSVETVRLRLCLNSSCVTLSLGFKGISLSQYCPLLLLYINQRPRSFGG